MARAVKLFFCLISTADFSFGRFSGPFQANFIEEDKIIGKASLRPGRISLMACSTQWVIIDLWEW